MPLNFGSEYSLVQAKLKRSFSIGGFSFVSFKFFMVVSVCFFSLKLINIYDTRTNR